MDKQTFMLKYILCARSSGRNIDSDHENSEARREAARVIVVEAASDLYDKVIEKCSK